MGTNLRQLSNENALKWLVVGYNRQMKETKGWMRDSELVTEMERSEMSVRVVAEQ